MLKKTITYTDYNGVERTEDYYFNLSKTELLELEMSIEGGFLNKLQKVVDTQNAPFIVKFFKELILKAYGEKSDDGRRFIKSEELSTAFSQTEAYNKLFLELTESEDAVKTFFDATLQEITTISKQPILQPINQ